MQVKTPRKLEIAWRADRPKVEASCTAMSSRSGNLFKTAVIAEGCIRWLPWDPKRAEMAVQMAELDGWKGIRPSGIFNSLASCSHQHISNMMSSDRCVGVNKHCHSCKSDSLALWWVFMLP